MTRIMQIIQQNFDESIASKQIVKSVVDVKIERAINIIINGFKNNNKLLICGNGGSAADSQHLAAEFTGRYEIERRPLPAIALTTDTSAITAIANDYSFEQIFSKQVEALGNEGDMLLAISTSGNSKNIIKAIESAKRKNMNVIGLTGKNGGEIELMLNNNADSVNICVPIQRTARIQEVHLIILHTICDAIDQIMFID